MRKYLTLLLMLFALGGIDAVAQDENNQILVFRNTGEVNLLYANEVDSIVFSAYDKDSVFHDDFVSQVFYAQDTTLVVPVEEIDSVAFGNRDAIVFQPGAHALTAEELQYITLYDGNSICYAANTPKDLLPQAGDKLFYGGMTDLFPGALCVKVNSVTSGGTQHVVSVTPIPINEMFSQLFYAGTVSSQPVVAKRSTHQIQQEIHIGEQCNISISGTFQLDTRFVVSPLTSYYNAKVSVNTDMEFGTNLSLTDVEPYHYESDEFLQVPFSPILGVLYPSCSLQAFADLNAELAFRYNMRRQTANQWEWTRKNGENTFRTLGGSGDNPADEAQMDITCKGEIFFGLQPTFQFSLPLDFAGARAKVRIGPSFSGEIGLGLLQSLQTYDPEMYQKGELDATLKLDFTGSVFHRQWGFGEESETNIFQYSFNLWEKKLPLFPDYKATRAVQLYQPENKVLSVSAKTDTPLLRELETGFEIVDVAGTTVDSVFVEQPILAGQTEMQGFTTEISLPHADEGQELFMRPVFHYAGHTIRARQVSVADGCHIQPFTAYVSNGASTFISGWPYIGSATVDSTLYNIGAHLPVQVADTVFSAPAPLTTGLYLDAAQQELLPGTWEGDVDGTTRQCTFADEANGSLTAGDGSTRREFRYALNTPQSGDIQMRFADDETVSTITVIMLNSETMRIKFKGNNESYLFTKTQNL